MGNSQSNEDNDSVFSPNERRSLKQRYDDMLETDKKTTSPTKLSQFFASTQVRKFGDLCLAYLTADGDITYKKFENFAAEGCRANSTTTLNLYWKVLSLDTNACIVEDLLKLALERSHVSDDAIESTVKLLIKHITEYLAKNRRSNSNGNIECHELILWMNEYAPTLPKIFITDFNRRFFSGTELLSSVPFRPPVLEGGSSIVSQCHVVPLALFTSHLQGRWSKLYTTEKDGLSFNRIAHHILGYGGPTCILIRVSGSDVVLGAVAEDRWRESNRFYGTAGTFLFSLLPDLRIYRSRNDSNNNYQWLNLKSYGMPHGLGLGGTKDEFRFFIPDSLEECTAATSCMTFEQGALGPFKKFSIEVMEVWGCGGDVGVEAALEAQAKDRGIRDDNIRKARLVDKAAFAGNAFDQEFLLSKTFSHKVRMADESAADGKLDCGDST